MISSAHWNNLSMQHLQNQLVHSPRHYNHIWPAGAETRQKKPMGGLGRLKQNGLGARNTLLSAGQQIDVARSGGTPDRVNNWKRAGLNSGQKSII